MKNYVCEDIEKFILLGYKPMKGRTIPKNLLITGHKCNLFAVITMFFVYVILNDSNVNSIIFITAIVLSLPIIVVLGVGYNYFALRYSVKKKFQRGVSSPYLGAISVLGGMAGIGFASFVLSRLSDASEFIVGGVIVWLIFLIFAALGCSQYHQVYMLHKYCPHLKDRRR